MSLALRLLLITPAVLCGGCFEDPGQGSGHVGDPSSGTDSGDGGAASAASDETTAGPADDGSEGAGTESSREDTSTSGGEDAAGLPCDAVDCGPNGTCAPQDGVPHCVCDEGWYADGLSCRQQHAYGESCGDASQCQSNLCVASGCGMPCHPLEPNDCGMLGVGGICVPLSNDGTEQGTCENGFDTGTDGEDAVLHIDQTISANIFPLSDLDAFTVVLPPASGIYRIAIQPANGILDPRVDFYDAGELVAMADVNGPGQQEGYVVEIDTADSVDVLHFVVRTDGAASGPYTITFDQP